MRLAHGREYDRPKLIRSAGRVSSLCRYGGLGRLGSILSFAGCNLSSSAGLLTRSGSDAFPTANGGSGMILSKSHPHTAEYEHHSSGTVRGSHPIPFSSATDTTMRPYQEPTSAKIRVSEQNHKFDFAFFSVLLIPLNPPFCKGGLLLTNLFAILPSVSI